MSRSVGENTSLITSLWYEQRRKEPDITKQMTRRVGTLHAVDTYTWLKVPSPKTKQDTVLLSSLSLTTAEHKKV